MDKTKIKRTETFASIFGDDYDPTAVPKEEKSTTLKVEQLVPFEKHPFKLYDGERLNEMIESIKNFGVIVPIVVRKSGLKYQILSGHNRVNAAREAGLAEVPAVIKEGLTEEEAILIVTETNLMQRSFSDLAHSERATVIATRHMAMKSQGVRTDLLGEIEQLSKAPNVMNNLTSCPLGTKLDSKKEVGKEFELSARTVARYLRINNLNSELKDLVDLGKVVMRAGVDLSYLTQENQEMIEAIVTENTFKVDMKKAASLREFETNGKLNWDTAKSIITGEVYKDLSKQKPIKIQAKTISKYFSKTQDTKDIEKIIEKALELFFSKQQVNNLVHEDDEGMEQE